MAGHPQGTASTTRLPSGKLLTCVRREGACCPVSHKCRPLTALTKSGGGSRTDPARRKASRRSQRMRARGPEQLVQMQQHSAPHILATQPFDERDPRANVKPENSMLEMIPADGCASITTSLYNRLHDDNLHPAAIQRRHIEKHYHSATQRHSAYDCMHCMRCQVDLCLAGAVTAAR
jgi:hypothetical protein